MATSISFSLVRSTSISFGQLPAHGSMAHGSTDTSPHHLSLGLVDPSNNEVLAGSSETGWKWDGNVLLTWGVLPAPLFFNILQEPPRWNSYFLSSTQFLML